LLLEQFKPLAAHSAKLKIPNQFLVVKLADS
jgi:hypothetical protein